MTNLTSTIASTFEKVFVLNLARRQDRYQEFLDSLPADWPFSLPERFLAIDGKQVPSPQWWRGGPGAWGCYRSHVAILEKCLNEGIKSALVLEDDAVCCEDFARMATDYLNHLPDDWGLAYFGGQHIDIHLASPIQVNEKVYRPFNVNRTHAFAYRGETMMRRVYEHLADNRPWRCRHHVDHRLGELHKEMIPGLYVPDEWLIAQREGPSDINMTDHEQTDFQGARSLSETHITMPVLFVVGEEQPACRIVAGVLHLLGVSMGRFIYDDPLQCPFRGVQLRSICNASFEPPLLIERLDAVTRQRRLRSWASSKCYENRHESVMIGGYHPTLPLLAGDACEAIGDFRFLVVENRLGLPESPSDRLEMDDKTARYVDDKLDQARRLILGQTDIRAYHVHARKLLTGPEEFVSQLSQHLGLKAEPEKQSAAIDFVKRTFGVR